MSESTDFRSGRQLAPGIYDFNGEMHIDLDVFILAAGGNPDAPRDRARAEATIARICESQGIPYEERLDV